MTLFLNLVVKLYKEIKKYIGTYRLQPIYIVKVITTYKLVLNIMKYIEIYSMIHSDSKASSKAYNVNNAEKMDKPMAAESIVKADCVKIDFSTKAV